MKVISPSINGGNIDTSIFGEHYGRDAKNLKTSPNPFYGIVMNFSDIISILISGKLMLAIFDCAVFVGCILQELVS